MEDYLSVWKANSLITASTMSISADHDLPHQIKEGYHSDHFISKLVEDDSPIPGVSQENQLWYVDSRLYAPDIGSIREDFF
jgi:hypothetical protein